mmetsp:Transcript_100908/g.308515  ORF Transcript_100908/g.308515 Transcript_100908/m.308515 type:complete len:365 (-) Transcript_100908:666-1760(-)
MKGEEIFTVDEVPFARLKMIFTDQGIGKPTRMSKMFEPIDEETAMSAWPFLATATEETASGIEVPAARIVKPMTIDAEQFPAKMMSPKISTHQTSRNEKPAIHTKDWTNVTRNHFSELGLIVSMYSGPKTGIFNAQKTLSIAPAGIWMNSSHSSSSSSSSSPSLPSSSFSSLSSFSAVALPSSFPVSSLVGASAGFSESAPASPPPSPADGTWALGGSSASPAADGTSILQDGGASLTSPSCGLGPLLSSVAVTSGVASGVDSGGAETVSAPPSPALRSALSAPPSAPTTGSSAGSPAGWTFLMSATTRRFRMLSTFALATLSKRGLKYMMMQYTMYNANKINASYKTMLPSKEKIAKINKPNT